MYLSAISYQPMSVSQNLKKQNSTVNFKAAKSSMTAKLPTYLMQERAAKKQTIDRLRGEINLIRNKKNKPENPAIEIDRLEREVVGIISAFNSKIDDYVYGKFGNTADYVNFYLH